MDNEGYKSLKVFQLPYQLAIEVFEMTKFSSKKERYSLTNQIRKSSRSVCVNIAEGYRKKIHPKHFRSKMTDAEGECSETIVWLDFSKDCNYISQEKYNGLYSQYGKAGKMLGSIIKNPQKFAPRSSTLQRHLSAATANLIDKSNKL